MPKTLIIQGCKDCPYNRQGTIMSPLDYECTKFGFQLGWEPPSTPHPDCKLNDLPSDDEVESVEHKKITKNPYSDADLFFQDGFRSGASWVIEQISK